MSLLRSPVAYGYRDISFTTKTEVRARIYFPATVPEEWDPVMKRPDPATAEIRAGQYPLVAFIHGDRGSAPEMCPTDWSLDYTRWGAVLHLLARCGIVVVVPDVSETIGGGEESAAAASTAALVKQVIQWMYDEWEHRFVLSTEDPCKPGAGWLGLAGHSWGAMACARIAAESDRRVRGVATISGTWTDERSKTELVEAAVPVVFINGTNETGLFSQPSFQPYPEARVPKHQAALQGVGHWDWFPPGADIFPCSGKSRNPCAVSWQVASELCLVFFYKYLYDHWFLRPYLFSSPGGRPPLLHHFDAGTGCAIKIRWATPEEETSLGTVGEVTLGDWTEGSPW